MKKRILSILVAGWLCCCSVLSPVAALPVNATALPIPAGADAETIMILWNLLINGMLISGADPNSLNYESEKVLFDSFMGGLKDSLIGSNPLMEVTYTENGPIVGTIYYDGIWEDGTGALQIPDEETWAEYRVIDGGGSGDSGDDQEPDGPYESINSFTVNSGLLAYMGEWISWLWEGAITDVDPVDYYWPDLNTEIGNLPQYQWDGSYDVTVSGMYSIKGHSLYDLGNTSPKYLLSEFDGFYSVPVVVVSLGNGNYAFKYLYGSGLSTANIGGINTYYKPDNSVYNSGNASFSVFSSNSGYSVNVPVFGSDEAALAFLKNGTTTGLLNGVSYDYPALAASVPSVMSCYASGVQVSPNTLPEVNAAIVAASQAMPEPVPETDPAENTEKYIQAITDAVAAVAPSTSPDADPDPEPAPEPLPDVSLDMDIDKYKFDLTQVFPFCLPFDMIRLLEVLAAEPQAPQFQIPFVVPALDIEEYYTIDLSFLDSVAEVFRTGELIGFIFFLIITTSKLIKW